MPTKDHRRQYRFAVASPIDYGCAVKSVVQARPDRLAEQFSCLLKCRIQQLLGCACLPLEKALSTVEASDENEAGTFLTSLLTLADYCLLVVSPRSLVPLKKFLASLGGSRCRRRCRHRLLFVAMEDFEGLTTGLDLEAASSLEPIVFRSSLTNSLEVEEIWLAEAECWKAMFLVLNASPDADDEVDDSASSRSGWVRRAVDEFETRGASPDITGSSGIFSDDSLAGVNVGQLASEFEAGLRRECKLALVTADGLSDECPAADAIVQAFIECLSLATESLLKRPCRRLDFPAEEILNRLDDLDSEDAADPLAGVEYCLFIVSRRTVRQFRSFLPRLFVHLVSRRPGWSGRYLIASLHQDGDDDGELLSSAEVDFLSHPLLRFGSLSTSSLMEFSCHASWRALARILRVTWTPLDDYRPLARSAYNPSACYDIILATSMYYSGDTDDWLAVQFAAHLGRRMRLQYGLSCYSLTAWDAINTASSSSGAVDSYRNSRCLALIATPESAEACRSFLASAALVEAEQRPRLVVICLGHEYVDLKHVDQRVCVIRLPATALNRFAWQRLPIKLFESLLPELIGENANNSCSSNSVECNTSAEVANCADITQEVGHQLDQLDSVNTLDNLDLSVIEDNIEQIVQHSSFRSTNASMDNAEPDENGSNRFAWFYSLRNYLQFSRRFDFESASPGEPSSSAPSTSKRTVLLGAAAAAAVAVPLCWLLIITIRRRLAAGLFPVGSHDCGGGSAAAASVAAAVSAVRSAPPPARGSGFDSAALNWDLNRVAMRCDGLIGLVRPEDSSG